MDLLEHLDQRVHLDTKDLLVLLVCLDNVVYLDLRDPREAEATLDFLDLKDQLASKESVDLKALPDHLDPLVRLEVPETLVSLDLLVNLVQQELWDREEHLDPRACKVSQDRLVFPECQV